METPKSCPASLDLPHKPSSAAPGVARKLKVSATDSGSHKHPTLKKKSKRVVELEARLSQLRDELKEAKNELRCAEECKRNACREANDAKKRLAFTSMKLDETRDRIKQLSGCCNRAQQLDRRGKSADSMRIELSATLDLVEELANELSFSNESEARALEEVGKIQTLLEVVKYSEEALGLENVCLAESHKSLLVELESLRNQADSLQKFIDCQSKTEFNGLKNEAIRLKDAIEAAKRGHENQRNKTMTRVRSVHELIEQAKNESLQRESELEAKLRESKTELVELQSKSVLRDLQRQEARLQSAAEENEALKSQIAKMEMERSTSTAAVVMDKSWQEADRELDAARATGLRMEAELQILKVQSDQWRKAAEVAAAMLSTENVGVDRTVSFGCNRVVGRRPRSPYYDEVDDYSSLGKRSGNMLKRITSLLKKGSR